MQATIKQDQQKESHLRKRVKELEQENKKLRTGSNAGSKFTTPVGKAPVSASRTRPRTAQTGPSGVATQNMNAPIGRTQNRILTLKQLKDTIQDMYAQKVKFDKKCSENKVGKETLE